MSIFSWLPGIPIWCSLTSPSTEISSKVLGYHLGRFHLFNMKGWNKEAVKKVKVFPNSNCKQISWNIRIQTKLILEFEVSFWSSIGYIIASAKTKVSCKDAVDKEPFNMKTQQLPSSVHFQSRCPPPVTASSVCCQLLLLGVVCFN